ncbi:MAG: transaldolase family protein [Gemmatimonadota bacterium]
MDPVASDTPSIEALAALGTINTIPEETLHAFADHGLLRGVMAVDGGDTEATLAGFRRIGVDDAAEAVQLQREGPAAFARSWRDLLKRITTKSARLETTALPAATPT